MCCRILCRREQEKGKRERLKRPKEKTMGQCQIWLLYLFTSRKMDALSLQRQKRREHSLFACALVSQASSACSTVCIQKCVQLNMFPAFSPPLLPPSPPRGYFSCFSSLSVKQWETSSPVQLPVITEALICGQTKPLFARDRPEISWVYGAEKHMLPLSRLTC